VLILYFAVDDNAFTIVIGPAVSVICKYLPQTVELSLDQSAALACSPGRP